MRKNGFSPSAALPPHGTGATGFVSLSHFSPAATDPTTGQWHLIPKHPVPAQFVDGRRVKLGEEDNWRVQSLLRLTAGSCLFFTQPASLRDSYGRVVPNLLNAPEDAEGKALPGIFHYALSYPWPLNFAPA